MNTILVPLDGSAVAEQVIAYVQLLAPILAARVRLIRVVSDEAVAHVLANDGALAYELGDRLPVGPVDAQRVRELLRQRVADYLARRAAELREAGLQVDVLVRDGSPAEQIIEVAEHDRATLIALATHGYSGLRRWTLGSVADKVVHAATTPIFLVRAAAQPPTSTWSVKRILVPLDGSALAEQALPRAIELARRAQAELILLQVVVPLVEYVPDLSLFNRPLPPLTFPYVLRERAQQQLTATIERFGMPEVAMTPVAEMGYPAEVIVDEAVRHRVDLIVMATHGYSGLRRWALGSVADKVLHASTLPLLLLRAQPGHTEGLPV